MESEVNENVAAASDDLDITVVTSLVHSMNMAASKLSAYPAGHPFVVEAFEKVKGNLEEVLQSRLDVTFGIAKDMVMLGAETLDPSNPIFLRFAQALFSQGIVGLTLLKGLDVKELMDFDAIIAQKRNAIYRQGGVQALLEKAGIGHIRVELIDYGLFRTDEELDTMDGRREDLQSLSFWEEFVKGVFEGTLDPGGSPDIDIEPEILASMLHDKYVDQAQATLEGLDLALVQNIKRRGFGQLAAGEEAIKRLCRFIESLDDGLRRPFLERFFGSLSENPGVAENTLSFFSDKLIFDSLAEYAYKRINVPPSVLRILKGLAKSRHNPSTAKAANLPGIHSKEALAEKLRGIFEEDEIEQFMPDDYEKIVQDAVKAESLAPTDRVEIQQLALTLTSQSINNSLALNIVDILTSDGSNYVADSLKHRLKDCCTTMINNGDFHLVLSVMEAFDKQPASRQKDEPERWTDIVEILSDKDFVQRVLTAAAKWGKEKQFHIARLITRIGSPFAAPLLDRLAEEGNKTLRLFYVDTLAGLGASVKDHVIERLSDKRWYVVRNLLTILRRLNDPSVASAIHPLLDNPHPRVRQEVLQILILFNDPEAVAVLLREMDVPDMERCLKAIMIAGTTRNPEVLEKLLSFLKKKGFSENTLRIKLAAVQALSEIGDPGVLPLLQGILRSFSLFSRRKSRQLKIEIVKSMGRYPAAEVAPLLAKIASSGSGPLAHEAALAMKTLKVGKA